MAWRGTDRIPTSSVRVVVAGLQALGQPTPDLPEPTIPISSVVDLLDRAIALGGPAFGVSAGRRIPPGALGLVDHLCAAAPTGVEMLDDLRRYFALVASGVTLRLEPPSLVLDQPALPTRYRRLLAELVFSLVDTRMAARGGAGATAVCFPWARPHAAASTEARWPEVRFGAPDARMTFRPDTLDAPLNSANTSLRRLLDGYAAAELAQHPEEDTTAKRVRVALREALPGRHPSASEVAGALGMSPRSLRRALQAEGTRFSEVRDATLRSVAEQALGDAARSIGEVAWLLGYSEPSAFHRAFRRWTGATPEVYRQVGRLGP